MISSNNLGNVPGALGSFYPKFNNQNENIDQYQPNSHMIYNQIDQK